MVLRDNYLGSFTHFQTLYEYLEKRKEKLPPGDPIWLKYRPGKVRQRQSHCMLIYVLTLCLEQYATSSVVSACPTTYYVDSDGLDGPRNVEHHRTTIFQS
jgi:hypothetical protein